jgi:hypothetical protein
MQHDDFSIALLGKQRQGAIPSKTGLPKTVLLKLHLIISLLDNRF